MAIQKKKFTVLSNVLLVLTGLVFAGMMTMGGTQLLARVLPSALEEVQLIEWAEKEVAGFSRMGSSGGGSYTFELKNGEGKVSKVVVPQDAWERRTALAKRSDLKLKRSRLGGLPVALVDSGQGTLVSIPKGGVLEKLMADAGDGAKSDEQKETEFSLLLPFGGALVAFLLGAGIWGYLVWKLKGAESKQWLPFVCGSVIGIIGSFLWMA